MSCNRCGVLGIIAGALRNEASAKVAELFLRTSRLPYSIIHLPGTGGKFAGELVLLRSGREIPISVADVPELLEESASILISAPTYYEPQAHSEIAFWEKIFPDSETEALKDKYGIAIAVGGRFPQDALKAIVDFFKKRNVRLYAAIANNGVEDCFKCEVGKVCYISDALNSFDINSSIMQDIIATAHFEREEIPACCPGKVMLLPTVEELARRLGESYLSATTAP